MKRLCLVLLVCATARGDKMRMPCAPSPPSAFCQEKVATSSFGQCRRCANAADVGMLRVIQDEVLPQISAPGHSESQLRESISQSVALKCGLGSGNERIVSPGFVENVETFANMVKKDETP